MLVKVEQLELLFSKYYRKFKAKYFELIRIPGHIFRPNDDIVKFQLNLIKENNVKEIDIIYNRELYDYLSIEFPIDYRKPYSSMRFIEMDKLLESLETVNYISERKRELYIIGDIYGINRKTNNRIKLISHHEPVDYSKWNSIKRYFKRDQVFYYRNSEIKIIIFVDLSRQTDKGYIDRFKMNTDLISIMVSKMESMGFLVAPDFIPTEDIISVTDPGELLNKYTNTNSRLIIIGEKLNEAYKKALIKVKEYDKHVRMIIVPELDHKKLKHFFRQVSMIYNADRWRE